MSEYSKHQYSLPDCYIYLYHTDEYLILPQFPSSVSDNMESNFNSQNALSRTAPIFSYNNSGPRTVQVTLQLHRDMMNDLNMNRSNIRLNQGNDIIYSPKDDYVDVLIKKLQSIALPRYQASEKMVNPPMVAIRFGDDIFIKGVVASGGVSVTYDLPLLRNNKYAQANIVFTVSETSAYDADTVGKLGSRRGLTAALMSKLGGFSGFSG